MTGWAGVDAPGPSLAVQRALAPLLVEPAGTAIVTDFDGTLAPIVEDPARARPLDGAVEVMGALARRFGVAAVLSGRPVSFLVEQLAGGTGRASGHPLPGVRVVGLYGLEWLTDDGKVALEPGAVAWRPVIEEAAGRLGRDLPSGVLVETKSFGVTVHWRRSPGSEAWAVARVGTEAARTGLVPHAGRMSLELRPPLAVDKGSTTRGLAAGCSAACYLGDDLGDLPAFAALSDLAARGEMATVSVAAIDEESTPAVADAADVVINGPLEALGLLRWLADQAAPVDRT